MTARRASDLRWTPFAALLVLATVAALASGQPLLALAPALATLGLLLLGRYPHLGLYAIVFLIPFGNFRSIAGGVKIHWVLAVVLLVVVALRLLTDRAFLQRLRSNLWPFLIGFLVVSLLSALLSDYKANAFGQVALSLVAVLFFALTLTLVTGEGVKRHLPTIVAVSVSLGSSLAVIGNLTGVAWFSEGDTFSRSTGGTGDPNALAMQVIFGLPFLVFWLTHARHPFLRVLAVVLIVANVAAMVGTYSRSGALVLAACVLTLALINLRGIRPQQLGLLLVGAGMVVTVGAALLPQSFWERQATLFSSEGDRSLSRRGSYLVVARDAVIERPLLGHGPGTFRDLYALTDWAELYQRGDSTKRRYAHNTYVEVLVGTGILGAVFYLTLIALALRNLFVARRALLARGDLYHADLVAHYIVAFAFLLLYMTMFSDVYQKFMLLCLGLSQVWLRCATEETPGTAPTANGPAPGGSGP